MMRTVVWILSLLLNSSVFAFAQGEVDRFGADELTFFFPKIHSDREGVAFTRSSEDADYKIQIADLPPASSPPGSEFKIAYGTPFRLFAREWEICFLPIFKDRGVNQLWLIEQQNRRGDVHVGFFSPSESAVLPLDIHSWSSLMAFEKDCTFGAGMTPRKKP